MKGYNYIYSFLMKNTNQLNILLYFLTITVSYAEYIPPGPLYRCPIRPEQLRLMHPCKCDKGTDAGIFVTCENSGLATLSIGLKNIATFNLPMEQLILNDCSIEKLYGPLLHMLKVRILRIENTPIRTIEENTLYGINRTLQELYLINTKLEKFPKEAFKILGNLTKLQIDKHEMANLDKDIFYEGLSVGKLERLHITNGKLTEILLESFQPLRKLKTLDLHGNNIKVLKKNQFKGLRDVEVLDISYNNITKLESSHIADLTKLSWCNVSHNHLSEMTRGMFARNAVLRVLHMNHNKLKRLDTNSFRGMRFLRRLYLSDNEIVDVGRGTFGSITRIGTIDLARNKIKKIDFQMFYQLNYVEVLDVAENQITEIQKLAFKDIYLTHINISHNMLSTIEPGAFENCANITVLDLSHNNLTEIPQKAFDATTYATELQLSYNQFTLLNQVPVHDMAGLKILNVSHNMIHSIPKNTFPKLYELHTVDVSYNVLTDISSAVFQSLFSLRYLNLSHNSMELIKPPTFGTLPTVLSIDLSHNLLRDISKGSLAKLASCRQMDVSNNYLEKIFLLPISLGEINLSYNNISEIPENVWPAMNSLLKLDLSYNPLTTGLSTESFRGLLTLQTLVLTNTSLINPPWESLNALSSLQYLKLNKNNITKLNKAAFGRLPIVFDLDLSDNQITYVSPRAFDGLLQLLALSFRNNNLTNIPNSAFYGLVSLSSLDLSNNYLEKIDNKTHGLLDDCLSIERVNLSHNKISFITRKSFPSDPYIPYKLREIDLSYNAMPVLTVDMLFGTKNLKVLNVSNNILNEIRKNVISNFTQLEELDLSHNSIYDITSDKNVFRLPSNIRKINLSNNKLMKLPVDEIYKVQNFTYLNVENNMLEYFDDKLVMKMKEKNFSIAFSGNPLKCDCFTRPLKHYFDHLPPHTLNEDNLFSNVICAEPLQLKDTQFLSVDNSRLNCIENVAVRKELDQQTGNDDTQLSKYESETDLMFRDVEFSQKALSVSWYVQTSKDIADFRVIIRNSTNFIFYGTGVAYNLRSIVIKVDEQELLRRAIKDKVSNLELCILGGKSASEEFKWFQSQCTMLPGNFELIKKDLSPRSFFRTKKYSRSSAKRHYNLYVNVVVVIYGLMAVFII